VVGEANRIWHWIATELAYYTWNSLRKYPMLVSGIIRWGIIEVENKNRMHGWESG